MIDHRREITLHNFTAKLTEKKRKNTSNRDDSKRRGSTARFLPNESNSRVEGEHPVHADDIPEVQFFMATNATSILWRAERVTQRLLRHDRRKGETTRTCSLERSAHIHTHAYTCSRNWAAKRTREKRKKEKASARFICPNFDGRCNVAAAAASEECISHSGSFAKYILQWIRHSPYVQYMFDVRSRVRRSSMLYRRLK